MNRRHDPFTLALASLRARLESGVHVPGGSIVILDEARRLKLSTTPVREALGWLCGFGLVERGPTGGFLAPRLDPQTLRARLAFRLHCLGAGLDASGGVQVRDGVAPRIEVGPQPAELMAWLVRSTGNAALMEAYDRVASQLVLFGEAETRLFADHEAEADALVARFRDPTGRGLGPALAAYHQRRMAAAPLLIMAVETARDDPAAV